jgi:hypothetical protein
MNRYAVSIISLLVTISLIALFTGAGYMKGVKDGRDTRNQEVREALLVKYQAGMQRPIRLVLDECGIEMYVITDRGVTKDVLLIDRWGR